jgi:hypothetical protein
MFPGGVHNRAFGNLYAKLNTAFAAMATPVDADTDGALLAQARAERRQASALANDVTSAAAAPFRDVMTSDGQNLWVDHQTLYPLLDKINASGIPVYLIDGWYDIYDRDDIMIYTNLTVPKRLLIRPTDHAGIEAAASDVDYGAEAHRWFDYWLKGIQNGIMDEPPIHYYLQGVENQQAYQSTNVWPPRDQALTPYYFRAGTAAGNVSGNSGSLEAALPTDPQAFDAYTVDYTPTTGPTPHWTGLAMPHQYPNMRTHDSKALTYTTPPLETAVAVTGHPIVHIWLSTSAPDLDTFVYLEEVDAAGNSTYITQGELRASLRQLNPAPFANFGLPWHNYYQSEVQPIPAGQSVELVFDLFPTAWKFMPGKQIRVTVAFADAGNFDTPVLSPAPTLQILRDAAHPSFVDLPVIQ